MLVMAMARAFGKRIAIKLTSFGHDDALSMRRRGMAAFEFYQRADCFIGVSPQFETAHRAAGLAPERYVSIPNGVDLTRFSPATAEERRSARHALGLDPDRPVVLFVGFFSHEKRPDLLYQAWADVTERGSCQHAAAGRAHAIDLLRDRSADGRRPEAGCREARAARPDRLRRAYARHRAVLQGGRRLRAPDAARGHAECVLEAMASAVPPIVTNLAGVTDWIVEDGVTGLLVPPNDRSALAGALTKLLSDDCPPRDNGSRRRARASKRASQPNEPPT